jgi:hypothetical protein
MSKNLTWLTHKHLLELFFMDLIVNAPEGSELQWQKLKRAMVKILMSNLATKEQCISTINFLLLCLSKFCILGGLIYLKNINV